MLLRVNSQEKVVGSTVDVFFSFIGEIKKALNTAFSSKISVKAHLDVFWLLIYSRMRDAWVLIFREVCLTLVSYDLIQCWGFKNVPISCHLTANLQFRINFHRSQAGRHIMGGWGCSWMNSTQTEPHNIVTWIFERRKLIM